MFTCENIETLVAIMAKEFGKTDLEIFEKINAENPELLPAKLKLKIFPKEPKGSKSAFATKVAQALAEQYNITPEEIQNPSGKNGKILVSDIKAYHKSKTPKVVKTLKEAKKSELPKQEPIESAISRVEKYSQGEAPEETPEETLEETEETENDGSELEY